MKGGSRMITSAYVHVPFCRSICAYCDFARWMYQEETAWEWLRQLEREAAEKIQAPLTTLYIGGGTPNALTAAQLEALLALFDRHHAPGMEFTLEANPEYIDDTFLSICARHGVNRLSIGVQSFEKDLLRRMNRSHDAAQIEEASARARAHGIENLSIDLIYGLPGQTLDMWLADLQKATALPITHISLYSLTIEENSAFGRMGVLAADDELEYQMYAAAIDDLRAHGFVQSEVANFARNQAVSRHNLVYWHYEDFHGIGCGASGKRPQGRYDNTRSLQRYLKEGPCEEWTPLSVEEQMFEAVMMGLRLREGIDLERFAGRYHKRLEDHFSTALQKHLGNDLVIKDGFLKTSEQGKFLLHDILVDFL